MSQVPDRDLPQEEKEQVELSAAEMAQQYTKPVEYHYAVMQAHNTIQEECTFEMFYKYLSFAWPEQRPWGLHRLNVYMKPKVKKTFTMIANYGNYPDENNKQIVKDKMNFDSWKLWWNEEANRSKWDGGALMEHLSPPGSEDPFTINHTA